MDVAEAAAASVCLIVLALPVLPILVVYFATLAMSGCDEMCLSVVQVGPVQTVTGTTESQTRGNGTWNGYAAVEVRFRILPGRERVDVNVLSVPWSRAGAGVTRQTKHDV